jgi:GNAT superfamily N-acetyltransferase
MRPQLRAFTAADVGPAGRLLAVRHAAHRRHAPLLAERHEDPVVTTAEVAAVWSTDGASGAVATAPDGHLFGYLLGAPKPSPVWGANVWVESAGLALDVTADAELARDLYATAAAAWVEAGRIAHYVLLPSYDTAVVDAWFRLAFGLQHVHAIRPPAPTAPPADGLLVRRAARADIAALARLDLLLPEHQSRSPVFSAGPLDTLEERLADWEESFDDPDYVTFVAERAGAVVASAVGCALEKSSAHKGLARPADAAFLAFAAVLPQERGRGAGRAVGDAVIAWAAGTGCASVVTDWRATNLLSSRTWPRLGFEPTFLRLHRLVGY